MRKDRAIRQTCFERITRNRKKKSEEKTLGQDLTQGPTSPMTRFLPLRWKTSTRFLPTFMFSIGVLHKASKLRNLTCNLEALGTRESAHWRATGCSAEGLQTEKSNL
ncbi:hypothetical protein AMTR_s00106p00134900 [Amborella trichopoda]|uniref:Uncharacterized protein n=1 Tax=Amborella trichopoda TaxID=13333 RepID=W1NTG6_AMBTC|nr:hypothetical protein AMTR_s00106p00134900 [Amborella trichopoda]